MKQMITLLCGLLLAATTLAAEPAFDAQLAAVQSQWAIANYRVTDQLAREKAFEDLAGRAAALSQAHPSRAEALVWEGIVLSTYAGVKGGLGALGLAKQARERLDAALALDPAVLDGSAYTSLGTLYHKVPGFPLGFGSDKKARDYLEKALGLNPDGIDANFFYGEFLLDEGDYAGAVEHLQRSLSAPGRPGREVADEGRRQEARQLLEKARAKLG